MSSRSLLVIDDEPQIRRVVRVDNAFKYAPSPTPIEVTGGVDRDVLVFRVSDHGNGIAGGERDGVFTPFYRSPLRPSDARSGGLGLSIARRLAEAQGGTLTYADRDGGGAIFELRLPAAAP